MRIRLLLVFLLLATTIYSQSKKELEAKVQSLETEIKNLKSQLEQIKKENEVDLSVEKKKAGYGMGVLFANNVRSQGGDSLDVNAIIAAVKDVYANKALKMDQQQCMTSVQTYMKGASEKKNLKLKEIGKTFLEENKKNPGVKVLPSGLQYKVITQGAGKTPTLTNKVTVHYTGKLIDGTIFDSSVQRGQPIDFSLTQVIQGWTEALQLMKEGDKWMLFIPYELAYGERGSGPGIPPFATLIFEVELIKVN